MTEISTKVDLIAPWVVERTGRRRYIPGTCTAIGLMRGEQIIAGTIYEDFNGANLMMHVASQIGRHWAQHEYLHECFKYPFEQLGCRRVTAVVADTNRASLLFVRHIGFEVEAVLKGAHKDGDLIVHVMWRDKCQWIGESYELRQIRHTAAA